MLVAHVKYWVEAVFAKSMGTHVTTSRAKKQRSLPWLHRYFPGFRRSVASLLVTGAAIGIGPLPHAMAATPMTATPKAASVQPSATAQSATPTTATPTASYTSTPPPTPSPTATPRVTASPSPSVSPTPAKTPSVTASLVHASPTIAPLTQTPSPATPTASATATASTTPTASATSPSLITPLLTPTNISATPPPPPGPTLDLSGLQILDNPGVGGNALIARTALRHYGEYYRPDGVPWVGWCEMFVGNVLAEAGIPHTRYASAIVDAISGPLYRGQAPAGSLIFFDQRSSPYGHVGIALGDGTMLSALGGGVVRTTYADWVSYLGWRPYGTPAPNDAPIDMRAYQVTTPDSTPVSLQAYAASAPSDATLQTVGHAGRFANASFAAATPNDTILQVVGHAGQFADGASGRLTPSAHGDQGAPSSLLTPHKITV